MEQALPELQLNPAEMLLNKGAGAKITPTVSNAPKGVRVKKYEWSSSDPDVAEYAKKHGITRALAAVELHREYFRDCIFLCGNAPLALAGVVKLYAEHGIKPALIVGMPVGFVNVVESKKLLDEVKVPWIRLNGRRGGSPFAVAALHGIMENELT